MNHVVKETSHNFGGSGAMETHFNCYVGGLLTTIDQGHGWFSGGVATRRKFGEGMALKGSTMERHG